jgi:hypothetical protein
MARFELFESLWLESGERVSSEVEEKLDMMVNMGYNVNSDVDHDLFEMEMRDGKETQTE